ncbi:MAG: amidohydrolase family protein [Gemmatimonadota bacterium]
MIARQRVVDSHVHLWDPTRLSYPWLGALPPLARPFVPEDYPPFEVEKTPEHAVADGTVDAIVVVEANCLATQGEVEVSFIERCAEHEPRIAGTIAFVDVLDEKRRRDILERLRRVARVRGVRHNIKGRAEGFASQPAFVAGVGEAGRLGFTFDLRCTADQLPEVIALVQQCPTTHFVVDHCAKPAIRLGAFSTWAEDVAQLALHDNVSCKLSGLLTEAGPSLSDEAILLPYAEHALACFGPARLMYGSDWPFCILGGGLSRWRAFVDRFTSSWSLDERDAFYCGNAIRIYGLTLAD